MSAVIEQPLTTTPAKREKSAYERLTRRQKRFVDELVQGCSAAEAMRRSGYAGSYPEIRAYKDRKKPEIRAAIEERTAQLTEDVGVRQHVILRQMLAIATADPRKLVDESGKALPLEQLDPDTAAAISSVEVENISIDGETGVRYKYKFWDKVKANDRLGQFVKLWDAKSTSVNVDARSVTINNGDSAAAAGALQAVLRFGQQLAEGRPAAGIETSVQDGSVLPAEVHSEPAGRGASVAVGSDSGRTEGA